MGKTIEELLKEALVPVEEHPYEVPENWVWSRFGYLTKATKLGLVRSTKQQSMSYMYAYLKMNNITNDGKIFLEDLTRVNANNQEVEEYSLKKGDFLFNTRNSKELVGKNAVVKQEFNQPFLFNNNIMRVQFYDFVLPELVTNYLNSTDGKLELEKIKNVTTNVAAIYAKNLNKVAIPLPPLSEQQRIVTKIESLFSKIDKSKELIEEAREGFENRKSAFLAKAFRGEMTEKWREENPDVGFKDALIEGIDNECSEKFYRLPKTWRWVQIKEILREMKTKKPSSIDKHFFHYIDIDSIDNKKQEIREMKIVEVDKAPSRASRHVEKGDVVISLVRPYLKNIALVEYDQNDMIASTGFYVCKTKSIYEPKLLYYYLKSEAFTNLLTSLMRGDNSPSVRISEFPEQLIPLPPLEEQQEIVRVLDNLLSFESRIEELTELEEQIELLKKSILAKAFRGELGTNDPAEESAIELLKEVLKE